MFTLWIHPKIKVLNMTFTLSIITGEVSINWWSINNQIKAKVIVNKIFSVHILDRNNWIQYCNNIYNNINKF